MCLCECDDCLHYIFCSPWCTWLLECLVTSCRDCFAPVRRGLDYCCENLGCCQCFCPEEGCSKPFLCLGQACESCLKGSTDCIRNCFDVTEKCSKLPGIIGALVVLAFMLWGLWQLIWMPDKDQMFRDARAGIVALRAVVPG